MTLTDYAHAIRQAYGKSIEAHIALGRLLQEVKKALPHGEWLRLFPDHDAAVPDPVPFSSRTAQEYIRIAANPVLSNPHHGARLPESWRTLAELARLPIEVLEQALHNGQVHPIMQRHEVQSLLSTTPPSTAAWSIESLRQRLRLFYNSEIDRAPLEEQHHIPDAMRRLLEEIEDSSRPELREAVSIARDELDLHDAEPGGFRIFESAEEASTHPGSPTVIASCKSTHQPWYRDLTTRKPGVTALRRRQVEARLNDIDAGTLPTARTAHTYWSVVWAIKDLAQTSPLSRWGRR